MFSGCILCKRHTASKRARVTRYQSGSLQLRPPPSGHLVENTQCELDREIVAVEQGTIPIIRAPPRHCQRTVVRRIRDTDARETCCERVLYVKTHGNVWRQKHSIVSCLRGSPLYFTSGSENSRGWCYPGRTSGSARHSNDRTPQACCSSCPRSHDSKVSRTPRVPHGSTSRHKEAGRVEFT